MTINHGYVCIVGAVIAWLDVFLPGVLFIFGILPFWGKFKNWDIFNRTLPGLNAAGIGLIVT
jgi:chromate transporter